MSGSELLAMPTVAGLDQWLFSGRLVERWNANTYHSPAHARTLTHVCSVLWDYSRSRRNDFVAYGYGCPYRLGRNPDTIVSFDAGIVRRSGTATDNREQYVEGPPHLAVEIVEVNEEPNLLNAMVDVALTHGVKIVWVVDPFDQKATVHRTGQRPVRFDDSQELTGEAELPGFRCPVSELFRTG